MGAAASTESEKDDLRRIFSVFSSQRDTVDVTNDNFKIIVKENAPNLWQKLYDTGDGDNAMIALQAQLEGARRKLNVQNGIEREQLEEEQTPPLLHYDWAKDTSINLQKGLVAGMLSPVSLPRVKFIIGEGEEKLESQPTSSGGICQDNEVSMVNPTTSSPIITTTTSGSRLVKGTHALVKGIVGKPETNNLEVIVEDWDSVKSRYLVKFIATKKMALLKHENLSPMTPCSKSTPSMMMGITALIDSGAEHSALSPAMVKRFGLSHLIDSKFAGNIGGVGMTTGYGRVHFVKLYFNNATTNIQKNFSKEGNDETNQTKAVPLFEGGFDVFEWPASAIDFDAILGIDFLSRYSAVIDVGKRELILNRGEKEINTICVPLLDN